MPWIKTVKNGVRLSVRVSPRASRDEIDGLHGTSLKIRIKAPPVDGKANAYLIKFIAGKLGLPVSAITLERGESSREKHLLIGGLTEREIRSKLTTEPD